MYRVLIARSGSYYVQRPTYDGWKKIGGFFKTRRGAERFIRDVKYGDLYDRSPRVVGYY